MSTVNLQFHEISKVTLEKATHRGSNWLELILYNEQGKPLGEIILWGVEKAMPNLVVKQPE